jgi:hypothetical protein
MTEPTEEFVSEELTPPFPEEDALLKISEGVPKR